MDLPGTLLRSITRSFYAPEHILILDAVILHSTLRDDDLAHLLGHQTKHVRKLCTRLLEDGLMAVHSRLEFPEGSNRPRPRDYYFVDAHRAIDVVKFRIKSMAREVDRRYGQGVDEKKEYCCPRCKSEFTQMEVLDLVDPMEGDFLCSRCQHALELVGRTEANAETALPSAGHEVASRLNAQMAPFEDLLRRIDNQTISETNFDVALSKALPVKWDDKPQTLRTQPADSNRLGMGMNGGLPPATVRGLKMGNEKVEVNLLDDSALEVQRREEAERRAKVAVQNELPAWHTQSTVKNDGVKPDPARIKQEDGPAPTTANGVKKEEEEEEEGEDDRKDVKPALFEDEAKNREDKDQIDAYYAALQAQEEEDEEEEDSESDSDSADEDKDEDGGQGGGAAGNGNDASDERPGKRVKLDVPGENGTSTKDTPGDSDDDSEG